MGCADCLYLTVLSNGALELSKEKALVARLSSIEEFAGMDILCTDKTGTLTLNQLVIDREEVRDKTDSVKFVLRVAPVSERRPQAVSPVFNLRAATYCNIRKRRDTTSFHFTLHS